MHGSHLESGPEVAIADLPRKSPRSIHRNRMNDHRCDFLPGGVSAALGSGDFPSGPGGSLGRSSSSFLVSPVKRLHERDHVSLFLCSQLERFHIESSDGLGVPPLS